MHRNIHINNKYTHIYIYIYLYISICMYIYVYCVHIYIFHIFHIYIYIYIYIYKLLMSCGKMSIYIENKIYFLFLNELSFGFFQIFQIDK